MNTTSSLTDREGAYLRAFRKVLDERHPAAVRRMLLYGSKARGDGHAGSDLDILLVVDDSHRSSKREMRDLGHDLDPYGELLVSIMVYTESEWLERRRAGLSFQRAVERDGVPVP